MHPAIVRVRQLRAEGVSDREVRATVGNLVPVATGAYAATAGFSPEHEHLVRAHAVAGRLGGVSLSHVSGAVAMALPVPRGRLELVHLSPRETRAGHPRSRPGYHLHARPVPDSALLDLDGIAVTEPLRTALDCAASLPLDWAVAIADAALREQLFSAAALRASAAEQRRVKGAARMRALPDLASARAESPGESLLRMRLRRMGLHVEEQVSMPGVPGCPRVDFVVEGRLVVEFDGRSKYSLDGDPERAHWEEKVRHDNLVEAGNVVLRVVWGHLWDEPTLGARVNRALRRAPTKVLGV